MRHERGRGKSLVQTPGGRVIGALTPLFQHDVLFLVELAEHTVGHAVGLEGGPQRQAIGGEAQVIASQVLAGGRVETHAAVPLVEGGELGGDYELLRLRLDFGEPLAQRVHARLVGRRAFGLLGHDGLRKAVHLLQNRLLLLGVRDSDRARPLEGHVLVEVRDARDAVMLVDAADLVGQIDGDDRRLVTLHHQEGQAVGEPLFDDPLFKVRGRGEAGEQEQAEEEDRDPAWHQTNSSISSSGFSMNHSGLQAAIFSRLPMP